MSPNSALGMTPQELASLMAASGVANANQLAAKVGVNRSTALRWMKGERRIDRGTALLIRSVLKKKPKK